jgi:integrase
MPKRVVPISEAKVHTAKSREKEYKIFDGNGLFLAVTPSGGKLWRFKYRFAGKERLLSFGAYPEISLLEARRRRDEARRQVATGIDPGAIRQAKKQAKTDRSETFEVIAREWHGKYLKTWSAGHAGTIIGRLEKEVFPWLGNRPIREITAPEILKALRRTESRGALDIARRVRNYCGSIFRYAIATGRAEHDPAAYLREALPPVKNGHYAAPTDPKDVGPLLRAIDEYQGSFVVKCAMQLAPLFFVRPGELRHAEWLEIDFEAAQWSIPGEKMKMREPHIVPLSNQATTILKELQPLTCSSRYVFPSGRTYARPMSENAINAALRRMGFEKSEITSHGFRATARTILDEVLGIRPDIIEHQLAHQVRDPLGRAYNRTKFLDERRKMMQQWADYLDTLKR